jgi:thiamine biosynthesis protein ThiS
MEYTMVRVNGVPMEIAPGINLKDFLRDQGYDEARIAVGLNETVAPKADYSVIILKDGDVLEIFNFVSGG